MITRLLLLFLLLSINILQTTASGCDRYVKCRSELLELHWKCSESSRRFTQHACKINNLFGDHKTTSYNIESLFSACTSRYSAISEIDYLLEKQMDPSCSPDIEMDTMPIGYSASSCWSDLMRLTQKCYQLSRCCPVAQTCTTELERDVILEQFELEKITMKKLLEECSLDMESVLRAPISREDAMIARKVNEASKLMLRSVVPFRVFPDPKTTVAESTANIKAKEFAAPTFTTSRSRVTNYRGTRRPYRTRYGISRPKYATTVRANGGGLGVEPPPATSSLRPFTVLHHNGLQTTSLPPAFSPFTFQSVDFDVTKKGRGKGKKRRRYRKKKHDFMNSQHLQHATKIEESRFDAQHAAEKLDKLSGYLKQKGEHGRSILPKMLLVKQNKGHFLGYAQPFTRPIQPEPLPTIDQIYDDIVESQQVTTEGPTTPQMNQPPLPPTDEQVLERERELDYESFESIVTTGQPGWELNRRKLEMTEVPIQIQKLGENQMPTTSFRSLASSSEGVERIDRFNGHELEPLESLTNGEAFINNRGAWTMEPTETTTEIPMISSVTFPTTLLSASPRYSRVTFPGFRRATTTMMPTTTTTTTTTTPPPTSFDPLVDYITHELLDKHMEKPKREDEFDFANSDYIDISAMDVESPRPTIFPTLAQYTQQESNTTWPMTTLGETTVTTTVPQMRTTIAPFDANELSEQQSSDLIPMPPSANVFGSADVTPSPDETTTPLDNQLWPLPIKKSRKHRLRMMGVKAVQRTKPIVILPMSKKDANKMEEYKKRFKTGCKKYDKCLRKEVEMRIRCAQPYPTPYDKCSAQLLPLYRLIDEASNNKLQFFIKCIGESHEQNAKCHAHKPMMEAHVTCDNVQEWADYCKKLEKCCPAHDRCEAEAEEDHVGTRLRLLEKSFGLRAAACQFKHAFHRTLVVKKI